MFCTKNSILNILFFFLIFFSTSCKSNHQENTPVQKEKKVNQKSKKSKKKLNCKRIKTGTFVYGDFRLGETIIERTETKQFEHNEKQNYKATFDVEWLDNCTYLLKNKIVNGKPKASENLKVSIIDVKIDLYTVLVQSKNSDKLLELDIGIKSLK